MSTRNKNADLSFGDFIKNHRLGEGLTQSKLAELLGISKQRVCDIEKNRFHVSLKLCKQIAKKLDLPLEWLAKLALQDLLESEGIDLKVG
jgi:DNA-binding XRE family transcriptional regulator